ncbi:SusC/RagA family TonB-linked outer membrane protein [Sphingobacterium tabacisoli]|uniref:SusC/RagA family TonB-linked outer membrane protein n=1 Tax=Sphingobacterium tabacisoli TaxID=2044855 RepID=A0ABW5L832_9SPHI|nr:TonB-dependent receptor [Sphingobacterium tabacisoli]
MREKTFNLKMLGLLFLFKVWGISLILAQSQNISGQVFNHLKQPLSGATIAIEGTTTATQTDAEGKFTFRNISLGKNQLTVNYIGYQSQTIAVDNKTSSMIIIELVPDSQALGEVVVVGYGTQKRQDLTGSITTITPKNFNKGVVGSADQLLVGKVPGLIINRGGGDPTASPTIQLRGPSSLTAGTAPFYVIDGVPGADINVVSPEDIVSMDILRDASSTAIYGSRAANGVIMVTTKRGSLGKAEINYSGYAATENISNRIDVLSASEYRSFLEKYNMQVAESEAGYDTDWQAQLYRNGISHNQNLSINGGAETTKYSASINFFKNQGIVKKNDLQRLNGRITLDQSAFDNRLRLGLMVSNSNTFSNHIDFNVFNNAAKFLPVSPIKKDENYSQYGGYFQVPGRTNYFNPVAILNQRSENQERNTTLVNGKISVDILSGLVFDLSGSLQRNRYDRYYYQSREDFDPRALGIGYANRTATKGTEKVYEAVLNYSKEIENHNFKILVGHSYQNSIVNDGIDAINTNFTSDALGANNLGLGNPAAGFLPFSGFPQKQESILISYFGRINYNYHSRYMLNATVRRDGSSRFGANNRWALFPSIGAAWRISQEAFMKDQKAFDDIKLRVGYGQSGNQNIVPYASLLQFGVQGNQFMYDGKWVSSYGPSSNANPDLKWETTGMFNIGLDLSFLNNRIQTTVEYYDKKTEDLLYYYTVPTPPYLFNTLLANGGSMTNKGFEVSISADIIKKQNWTWTSSFNLSRNQNRIGSLSSNVGNLSVAERYEYFFGLDGWTQQTASIVKPGLPIGSFATFKYIGYDATAQKTIYEKANGELVTADKLSAITDYQVLGNALPDFTYGWNNAFTYNKFDLSFFFRGMYGNDVFNATRADLSRLPQAATTNISVIAAEEGIFEAPIPSSRWIEDASFLRLDNATVGYTFNLKNRNYFRNARVYFTGQNLFVLTNYSGIDPEVAFTAPNNAGALAPGIDDRNYYPKTRSFLLGLSLGF